MVDGFDVSERFLVEMYQDDCSIIDADILIFSEPDSTPIEALFDRSGQIIYDAIRKEAGSGLPIRCLRVNADQMKTIDQDPLVLRALTDVQLVILDMDIGAAAYYVLGVRQVLSKGALLALTASDRAENYGVLSLQHTEFDEQVRILIRNIINPYEADYVSALQRSKVFKVHSLERPFQSSGFSDEYWRMPAGGERWDSPEIYIWQGSIQDLTKVEDPVSGKMESPFRVWVNSENIYMEMARFWDNSISAQIRRLGAVMAGPLDDKRLKDRMGVALAEKMGAIDKVDIGHVFMTPTDHACELNHRYGVEHVAHLAAVVPREGAGGFKSGGDIQRCIQNLFKSLLNESDTGGLSLFGRKSARRRGLQDEFTSILIPLFGSGDGGLHVSFVAHRLVAALRDEFLKDRERVKAISNSDEFVPRLLPERIGLIAYQPSHRDYLVSELKRFGFSSISGCPLMVEHS